MHYRRFFAILCGVLGLLLAFRLFGPWEEFMKRWHKSRPPAPFHFASLRNRSDAEIARFMSGTPAADSFHPADAPDSNFPDALWHTAPKAAALAFAEANRTPGHRERFVLSVDASPALKAPDAGWLVFDPGSASCPLSSSGAFTLTVLRFGIDQPFLYHAATHGPGVWANPFVDRTIHSQQLIPLSPDEARFLAHTVFWLEHIQSEDVRNRKSGLGVVKFTSPPSTYSHSTADGFGRLDWQIAKLPPRRILETLWATSTIAGRWSGEYDKEASLNLINFLLTEALPKHLGKRWQAEPPPSRDSLNLPLAERLKPRDDPAARENLSRVINSALSRNQTDPWPAAAIISLAECAGDAGLAATLPALETLMSELPPPSADEAEFSTLDAHFRQIYEAPADPDERKKWDRYKFLQDSLEHDFPTQVRPPLARAIRQIRAMDQPAALIALAKSTDADASWALRRLHQLQPDAYAAALIARFLTENQWGRRTIFETLAALDPAAARRLRDSLTAKELADMLFEITRFEVGDDPQSARIRIPALLEIVEKPTEKKTGEKYPTASHRGPAIGLLAKLPLDPAERQRYERLLLKELLSPENDESLGKQAISQAAAAIVTRPDPDRFWDALYQATSAEPGSSQFNALLDALATLAIAKPEPHLAHLAQLLRPRIARHMGYYMDDLCMAALALDLRTLAPEILRFATSGPTVPDGEHVSTCKDTPCLHRIHSARHVSALWLEPDADTRARMWTALLLESPYDFVGEKTIATCLRDRCRSAIAAATPEVRKQLIAMIRANSEFPIELSTWLGTLP